MASSVGAGQVLQGTYRITRCIAKGGMGMVYEAEHLRLTKRRVAIKVLHPTVIEDSTAYARFRREAEIVSALGHPHILYVIDFNQLDDGQPYMVMEFLEGEDLKQRLHRTQTLTLPETSRLAEQAGSALQMVHDQQIVHRDLKPSNIFLLDAGQALHVKLLDFGISKVRHSKSVVTREESLIGTPHYMSPEQAKGSVFDIDHRTDIFSLAVILQYCLTGERPFDAPTMPGVLFNICYEPPRPILELAPHLPAQVAAVLARAMSKRKEERYSRVDQFTADFTAALAGVEDAGVRAPAVTEELSTPPVEETEPPEPEGHPWPVVEEPTSPRIRGPAPLPSAPERGEVLLPNQAVAALSSAPETGPQTLPGTLTRAAGEVSMAPPVEARRSNLFPVVAVAAVLAVGAMITAVLVLRPQAAPPSPAAAQPVPDAASPDRSRTAGDSRRRQATVLVSLRVAPANARVLLDGLSREDNPLALPPSNNKHVLRVEARGYTPREITFVATADLSLDVALQRSVRKPQTDAASKKSVESRRPTTGGRRLAPSPKTTGTKKRLKLYDDI